MGFHVPFSECAGDEFQASDGTWYSVFRAVSFDNWLLWRDALPPTDSWHRPLTPAVEVAIAELGRRIHEHHQRLIEYRRLDDSPFRVGRWWDPEGEEPWCSGRRVLLRHKRLTAQEFLRHRPPRCPLEVTVISTAWFELELPLNPAPAVAGPAKGPTAPPNCPTPPL